MSHACHCHDHCDRYRLRRVGRLLSSSASCCHIRTAAAFHSAIQITVEARWGIGPNFQPELRCVQFAVLSPESIRSRQAMVTHAGEQRMQCRDRAQTVGFAARHIHIQATRARSRLYCMHGEHTAGRNLPFNDSPRFGSRLREDLHKRALAEASALSNLTPMRAYILQSTSWRCRPTRRQPCRN